MNVTEYIRHTAIGNRKNDVFHHLLQHFDSTAFLNFNTYRDDRPLKNAIKRLKEQYKSK